MTQVTSIENRDEFRSLATQLGDELVNIQGEIDGIKQKLAGVSNYDGMNFEGVASLISTNLTNVITALQTLSGNVDGYIQELDALDQYDAEQPDADLETPELEIPEEGAPAPEETTPDETEPEEEGTEPEEETKPEDEETTPTNPTPSNPQPSNPQPSNPQPSNPQPSNPQPSNPEPSNPEPSNPEPSNPEPSNPEPSNPEPSNPQPSNPQPSNPQPSNPEPGNPEPSNPAPEFTPEELVATDDVVVGVGDPNVDVSNYTNDPTQGYTVTTGNTSYELSQKDYDLLCAIVAAESDGSYDNTMAVMSTVLNRCESSEYSSYGLDPIAQITAANQFEGYTSGEFQQYIGNTSDIVEQAVRDALDGVRNHASC